MPIQDPHTTLKRQSGGATAYNPRPFDEPQPTAPVRKPPVLQQHDRKDFPSNSQYQKAVKTANDQYERENTAYATEKGQYDKDIAGWRARKADWDTGENQKVTQSGAGQQRLQDYLKTPEGQKQQDFNAQMLAAPFLPAGLVATQFGKGMKSPFHKVGYGLAEIGAGEALRELEKQQQPDKYDDPAGYYKNQAWQNFLVSTGMGAGTGSLRSAFMKDKNAPAAAPPTTPEPTPQAPPVEPYKGNPKDVARYIAHDLGLTPNAKDTKADLIANALGQIKSGNATKEQIDLVAQRARGIDPETILGRIAKSNKPLAVILGTLGLGAGAAMEPDEAEAASVIPGVKEPTSSLNPIPSRGQQAINTAMNAAKGAAEAAPYAIPGVGEGLMARDLAGATEGAPSTPRPKAARVEEKAGAMRQDFDRMQGDANLAAAQREDTRQRAEMKPKPEPIGAEAARAVPSEVGPGIDRRVGKGTVGGESQPSTFVNPEQHGFDLEHLPEHERSHLDNPQAAHDKAAWMLPYLRAGAEAQKRGEDFFGGSDQYDKELGALKQFYHGRPQAPVAPEAPTEEEAPIGRKHGGTVHRKVVSIHHAFLKRLENQERKVKALEKAQIRKSSPKLTERLAKEKDEAKRIREHLERVKAHG